MDVVAGEPGCGYAVTETRDNGRAPLDSWRPTVPYDEGGDQLPLTTVGPTQQRLNMNRLTPKAQRTHRRLSLRPSLSGSLAAMAAAALFASVVTGCGSQSKTSESTTTGASGTSVTSATTSATSGAPQQPQGAQVIQESARTTQTLQSVHIALTATNLPKLPVSSVNADVTNQPQGSGRAVGDAKFRPTPNDPFVDTRSWSRTRRSTPRTLTASTSHAGRRTRSTTRASSSTRTAAWPTSSRTCRTRRWRLARRSTASPP